jgi:acetyltransferase
VLSDDSVYQRYAHLIGRESRMSHDRLVRTCFIDYSRQLALVALCGDEVAAIGRLIRGRIRDEAEFALLVADSFQSSGLGTELLRRLLDVARAEGIECVFGFVLAQNSLMLKVCRRLGFSVKSELRDPMVKASIHP